MDERDRSLLSTDQVLGLIGNALNSRTPFSLIRVGDGENLCMSQASVLKHEEIMQERWAQLTIETRSKGVRLPDIGLRDALIRAVKSADLVGIHPWNDKFISTYDRLKRPLAERVFKYHRIQPKLTCNASVTRVFPQNRMFWNMLTGRRVLLISQWATRLRPILTAKPYSLSVVDALPFDFYNKIPLVMAGARKLRGQFDIALVSCGVSAVILAVDLATELGCVAIDFGKASQFMVEKKAGLNAPVSRFAPRSL